MTELEKQPLATSDNQEHLAHYWHNELMIIKRDIENSYIVLGRILYTFRDQKLYAQHPHDFGKFEHYLADPGVNIKYSTAMQLIRVYEYYCKILGLKENELQSYGLDRSRLDIIRRVATKENYKDVLSEAKKHPRFELRNRIKELNGDEVKVEDIFNDNKDSQQKDPCAKARACPYSKTYQCPYFSSEN